MGVEHHSLQLMQFMQRLPIFYFLIVFPIFSVLKILFEHFYTPLLEASLTTGYPDAVDLNNNHATSVSRVFGRRIRYVCECEHVVYVTCLVVIVRICSLPSVSSVHLPVSNRLYLVLAENRDLEGRNFPRFLANVLRYVRYMLSAVRLSVCLSVVCLSVTLVHPTQAVELFGNFFHHTIAQGLYFSVAKNRWWGTPLSP